MSLSSIVGLGHLIGLALAVGAATVKNALLVKCVSDAGFVPTYLKVARPITRQIILGMALLLLSGIAWLLLGYGFTPRLIVKVALFGLIWVLGPVIDNVVEPRFRELAPATGQAPSGPFLAIRNRYLLLEITATMLFYVIVVIWVLR